MGDDIQTGFSISIDTASCRLEYAGQGESGLRMCSPQEALSDVRTLQAQNRILPTKERKRKELSEKKHIVRGRWVAYDSALLGRTSRVRCGGMIESVRAINVTLEASACSN